MQRRSRPAGSRLSARLHSLFARSQVSLAPTIPIRKTLVGTWVPTPLSVIENALETLVDLELLGPRLAGATVLDAGTGDGRLPVLLARIAPNQSVLGIERDAALFQLAQSNLDLVLAKRLVDVTRVGLAEGDFCSLDTYAASNLDPRRVGMVFNYPDGNQRSLARFIARHASPSTILCLLTHDRSLTLDDSGLTLRTQADVAVPRQPSWMLSVYSQA